MHKSILRKSSLTILALSAILSCGKDDDPTVAPNAAPVIVAQIFNASEDASNTDIFGKVAATDADEDALTFSLKTNSDDLFEITDAGDISLVNGKKLDFETTTSHILSIDVTDGTATANAAITITVIDIDENTPPNISAQSFLMTENGNPRGIAAITATDAEDNNNLTFSWPGDTTGRKFEVTASGTINSLVPLNFEEKDTYVIPVTVSDGMLSAMADITINIIDTNDFPEIGTTVFTVSEAIDDTSIIGNVTATDEDGDTLIYRITTDTDNLFEISAAGDVSLIAGKNLDYETKTQHVIKVEVNDGRINPKFDVTIDVTDIVEPQVITVSTLTGSSAGFVNGPIASAQFFATVGITLDTSGNIYVADRGNKVIRKITTGGIVSTYVGNPPSPGTPASLDQPKGIVFDSSGNLYATSDNLIKKFTPSLVESLFAGDNFRGSNNGTSARFWDPFGLAIDASNNIYVADERNNLIRKITPSQIVSTLAGSNTLGNTDGNGTAASFNQPTDIAVDSNGNLFVVDTGNHVIRKITPTGGVTTFAGSGASGNADGTGANASFNSPEGISIDANNNIYIADFRNYRIRKITPAGVVTTLAGGSRGTTDGDASVAEFFEPRALVVNSAGTIIYVTGTNRIRKITIQ